MPNPLMKCGHVAMATRNDKPVCPICIGIHPGADEVETEIPDLKGRMAGCGSCGSQRPSDFSLPFFEHHPTRDNDSYYCGCRGWD